MLNLNPSTKKLVLLSGMAICCLSGCVSQRPISISSVAQMQLITTNVTLLKIQGSYISSAIAVGNTRLDKTVDNILLVRVFPRWSSAHTSGAIDLQVVVDDSVDSVAFGNPESIIWRRTGKGSGEPTNR